MKGSNGYKMTISPKFKPFEMSDITNPPSLKSLPLIQKTIVLSLFKLFKEISTCPNANIAQDILDEIALYLKLAFTESILLKGHDIPLILYFLQIDDVWWVFYNLFDNREGVLFYKILLDWGNEFIGRNKMFKKNMRGPIQNTRIKIAEKAPLALEKEKIDKKGNKRKLIYLDTFGFYVNV